VADFLIALASLVAGSKRDLRRYGKAARPQGPETRDAFEFTRRLPRTTASTHLAADSQCGLLATPPCQARRSAESDFRANGVCPMLRVMRQTPHLGGALFRTGVSRRTTRRHLIGNPRHAGSPAHDRLNQPDRMIAQRALWLGLAARLIEVRRVQACLLRVAWPTRCFQFW
jgi:hypothetical protein